MKRWLKDHRGFLVFLLCIGFFRTAVADWNQIPSGSMRPTLLEGDVVLVDRIAYDVKIPLTDIALMKAGDPARGDVITFTSPRDGVRLIKRVVGLPGDVVELRGGRLVVNGVPAEYRDGHAAVEHVAGQTVDGIRAVESIGARSHAVQFLPAVLARRDFGPVTVPPDSFFFLGDNRDDSADSRYIGFVPRHRLIGRAHRILVSLDGQRLLAPRLSRFGSAIE